MLAALLGGRLNAVAGRGGFVIFSALLLAINANSIKLDFRRPPGDRGAIRRDERHTGVGETIANNGSNQIRWFGGRVGVAQDHTAQFNDDRSDAEMGDAAVRRRFGEEFWYRLCRLQRQPNCPCDVSFLGDREAERERCTNPPRRQGEDRPL